MSLIPTRSETPGAQAELDLATLIRARTVLAAHRPVHRSITVLTRPVEEVLVDLDAAIAVRAQLVSGGPTPWLHPDAEDGRPTSIGVHDWAGVLARHGWTGEVAEVLADADMYLPWMRFDSVDGCLTDATLPEVILAAHAAEAVAR